MKYSLYRAFQKLWINKKINAAIAIELIIGITVVLCGVSSSFSAKSRLELYTKQIGEQGAVIEYSGIENSENNELPIAIEDYESIKEEYGELEISYLIYTQSIYQMQKSSNVKDVTLICMDTNTFTHFFGYAPSDSTVYLGTQVLDDCSSDKLHFFEEWISWDEANVRIGDMDISNIEKLSTSDNSIFVSLLIDLDVDSMIILPEECMTIHEVNAGEQWIPCLRIIPSSNEDISRNILEITQTLQDSHQGYSYRVSEQYLELQKSIDDLTQDIRLFAWIAWFVLIITMVGIVGVWLIYLEKRKREFAIILALGGTHKTIFREVFLEIFALCLISGLISIVGTILLIPHLSTSVFTAHFHWLSVVVMFGIVLIVTMITCTCMVWGIRDVYPTKILKK